MDASPSSFSVPGETAASGSWTFITNHAAALIVVADRPDILLVELASRLGVTERAAQRIMRDLACAGYVRIEKRGRRNHYEVEYGQTMRQPTVASIEACRLVQLVHPILGSGIECGEPPQTPATAFQRGASHSWAFITNHGAALMELANAPDVRLADLATQIGVTERAAQRIVRDLASARYVRVQKSGRRNHYQVNFARTMRHRTVASVDVCRLVQLIYPHLGDAVDCGEPTSPGGRPERPADAGRPARHQQDAVAPPWLDGPAQGRARQQVRRTNPGTTA